MGEKVKGASDSGGRRFAREEKGKGLAAGLNGEKVPLRLCGFA